MGKTLGVWRGICGTVRSGTCRDQWMWVPPPELQRQARLPRSLAGAPCRSVYAPLAACCQPHAKAKASASGSSPLSAASAMLPVMDRNVTALERAFSLARSGGVADVSEIRLRLKREGYDDKVLSGSSLISQLRALIKVARAAPTKGPLA